MLRINLASTSKRNGVYYYRNEPFSGVAFTLNGCDIENVTNIKNGALQGEYSNEYLTCLGELPRVDSNCLEPEDENEEEPLCYKGKRFSGIAYDFDGDFCTGELYYVRGWVDSQIEYYKSGVISVIELIDEGFSQKYHWYKNGQIKKYEIYEQGYFEINLTFKEHGDIAAISIDGNHFNRFQMIRDKVKFQSFFNRNFAVNLSGSDYLYVSGSAVNNEVFDDLLSNDGLRKTTKLRICRTPLTAAILDKLVPVKNISELYIESEIISLEAMLRFKLQRPDSFVEFNRTEVVS